MSNAICVQGDCTTFLMYDKVGNQLVPFIKELCQEGDDYQVRKFNLDGADYGSTTEEIFPEDVNFDKEKSRRKVGGTILQTSAALTVDLVREPPGA